REFCLEILERHPHAELGGERNSNCGARAEEISQSALGYFKLLQAGERHAVRITNFVDGAARIKLSPRNLDDVHGVVRAGIVAVEEVEEFDEGIDSPALIDVDRPRHAQVRLNVRRAAEFVEAGLHWLGHS